MKKDRKGDSGENLQSLCDAVFGIGDILACYVVDITGNLLARNTGKIEAGNELRSRYGPQAAILWGVLKNLESVGGPLSVVSATYATFKVVGIPIPRTEIGILVTVPIDADSRATRDMILEFVESRKGRG